MGAVAVIIDRQFSGLDVVLARQQAQAEIGMCKIHAAVDHGNADRSERTGNRDQLPGTWEIRALRSPLVRSVQGIVYRVHGLGGLLFGGGDIPLCGCGRVLALLGSVDVNVTLDKGNTGLLAQKRHSSLFLPRGHLPCLYDRASCEVIGLRACCVWCVTGDAGVGGLHYLYVQALQRRGRLYSSSRIGSKIGGKWGGARRDSYDEPAGHIDRAVVYSRLHVLGMGYCRGNEKQEGKRQHRDPPRECDTGKEWSR